MQMVLVMGDRGTKAWTAMAVPEKGASDGRPVERLVKVIDEVWGRKGAKVICKADKEASTGDLRNKIRRIRRGRNNHGGKPSRRLIIEWIHRKHNTMN